MRWGSADNEEEKMKKKNEQRGFLHDKRQSKTTLPKTGSTKGEVIGKTSKRD